MGFLINPYVMAVVGGGGGGGLLASADFVNGIYSVDGVSVTAGDVVGDTGRISGSGVSITATPVSLLGDFRDTLLAADFSAVVEWTAATPQGFGHIVVLLTVTAADSSEMTAYTIFNFPILYQSDHPFSAGVDREADCNDQAVVGVNKLAYTCVSDRLSGSLNGGAVFTIASSLTTAAFNAATIAWHNEAVSPAGYIRKLDVYGPVDDADLPGLSA